MPEKVDLYNSSYANYEADVYRDVRLDTYGEDLGQTSWVTQEESAEIPQFLGLNQNSSVLEVGCGSGGYALHVAEKVGCRIVGLDVNEHGIRTANQLASRKGPVVRARFHQCDVSQRLPFEENAFDATFANDVLCHVPGRAEVLRDLHRVLRPGGRMLFTDALVVGGIVSHEEIAVRSSIGFYLYSPPGVNERLLEQARFRLLRTEDTTERAAQIAERRHAAREKRKTELIKLEGAANFEGVQRFLLCVHHLTAERRLLRFLYLAEKTT